VDDYGDRSRLFLWRPDNPDWGSVWCAAGHGDPREDGVRCYAANGDLIGKIHLPESCANLCFGGEKKNRLFICASTSIYALYVNTVGVQVP
jgi:gluconolactonase